MPSTSCALAAVFAVLLAAVGCSGNTTDGATGGSSGSSGATGGSSGGTVSRTGLTACGRFPDNAAKSCQAGQYCEDEAFSRCTTGCLTDNNCPAADTCRKEGTAKIGACTNSNGAPPPPQAPGTTTTCVDLCKKIVVCSGGAIAQQQCEDGCIGTPEACKACLIKQLCNAPEGVCKTECGT